METTKLLPKKRAQTRQGSVAVMVSNFVSLPKFSAEAIFQLKSYGCATFTRHFKKELLERTLSGSYRFGTISEYAPKDKEMIGRFSDAQEGSSHETIESRTNTYNIRRASASFSDVNVVGFEKPIVFETKANDYCSCASIGDFDLDRAKRIRERGNPDINAYAVYDLEKFLVAIEEIAQSDKNSKQNKLLIREIKYGDKDKYHIIDSKYTELEVPEEINSWLEICFVKSAYYAHEEEIRILLIDPACAGKLPTEQSGKIFSDPRIAECIVDYGYF